MPIPSKLKHDAILEALIEVRFEPPANLAAEAVVGKLVNCDDWAALIQNRLPLADIPAPVRQMDVNMRHQPIIEMVNESRSMAVKVGERVMSLHVFKPYPGWEEFFPKIRGLIQHLFGALSDVTVHRLGLRYINAFIPGVHGIEALASLQLNIKVANESVFSNYNFNYITQRGNDLQCLVKVASPDFVQGSLPKDVSGFVDVDVYTPTSFKTNLSEKMFEWLEAAHVYEKEMFFKLLSEDQIQRMNQ